MSRRFGCAVLSVASFVILAFQAVSATAEAGVGIKMVQYRCTTPWLADGGSISVMLSHSDNRFNPQPVVSITQEESARRYSPGQIETTIEAVGTGVSVYRFTGPLLDLRLDLIEYNQTYVGLLRGSLNGRSILTQIACNRYVDFQ